MKITYLTRAEVPYNDDYWPRRGYDVDPDSREGFVTHHTVGADSDSTKNRWETWAEIIAKAKRMQYVRPDLGYDVPYNFLVFWWFNQPPGSVEPGAWELVVVEGRGWDRTGAHTAGHNTRLLAWGHVGDFRYVEGVPDDVLDEGLFALGSWIRTNARANGIYLDAPEFSGHRDHKDSTTCPGGRLYARLDRLEAGYQEGGLVSVSPEVLEVLENADAVDLQFAIDEAKNTREKGGRPTSVNYAIELLRQLAALTGVQGNRPAEIVTKLNELWDDDAVDNSETLGQVVEAFNAAAAVIEGTNP